MKCLMKVERPGHQKSHSRTALVQKTPICPDNGEEWMEWSRAERAEGGMNMRLRKYRWPLSKDQSEREARVNRGEPSSKAASVTFSFLLAPLSPSLLPTELPRTPPRIFVLVSSSPLPYPLSLNLAPYTNTFPPRSLP